MRLASLLIVSFCVFAPGVHGQPPAAPERLVHEYVTAFNAGDDAMREFFRLSGAANVPVEQRMDRYHELRSDMGRLTVRRVDASAASSVVAEMADAQGGAATFTFVLAGGKLEGIRVMRGGPGAANGDDPPLPPRTEAAALEEVKALVSKAVAADEFSGVVLIEKRDGARLWSTAAGEADKEQHRPNTMETRFNVGSIGKSLTTTAIAQLVSEHKLSLDDTVGKFLPSYPNETVRQRVTIRMLLEMQSGIGDIFGPRYERTDKATLASLADFLPLFAEEPLHFEPGTKREYSNGGFVVLGLVVEKVSGQPYHEYVQRRIIEPAGMKGTDFLPPSGPVANRATGYTTRLGGARRSNVPTLPQKASSAGGVHSTAQDLLRYADALSKGVLVNASALAAVGSDPRGMGIAGGSPGANAALETGVNGYSFVVLSNYDPPSAERIARAISRVLDSVK